nr:hypothetical protein [uncultured Allomuricauda sp.]
MKQKKSVSLLNLILLTLSVQGLDNAHRMSCDAPVSEYLAEDPREREQAFGYLVPDDTLVDAPYIIHLLPALHKTWKHN